MNMNDNNLIYLWCWSGQVSCQPGQAHVLKTKKNKNTKSFRIFSEKKNHLYLDPYTTQSFGDALKKKQNKTKGCWKEIFVDQSYHLMKKNSFIHVEQHVEIIVLIIKSRKWL